MANRDQRRQRRKEQHQARRRARKLGFDPQTIDDWAALIIEADLIEIRDLVSLPDRILKEIGAGQAIQIARALLPTADSGIEVMSIDDWEAFLHKSGAMAIDPVLELIAGACFAMIGHQSAKARSDGIDGIDTTPGSATRHQLDHAAQRCGVELHWRNGQLSGVEVSDGVVMVTSMLIVERIANVGRYGDNTVIANLRAGQTEPRVLSTGPDFFAPREVEIGDIVKSLRGATITEPITGETGDFNPLGKARHLFDNAEELVLQHGYRLPADAGHVPPWWFYPTTDLQDIGWIGYRFDNRTDAGTLQVVAEITGAHDATSANDTYDWVTCQERLSSIV